MFNEIDFRGIDPWAEAPSEEPLRQYYYMARIRAGIAPVSAAAGRPLTYHLETFGCQMNEKQSEVVAGTLDAIGYERVHGEEAADVVLYNTCTVRENANLKVYGRLGRLRSIKGNRPDLRIVLFGCMMQEPEVVERIRREYPFVNLVFGTHNLFQFAELFCGMLEKEGQLIDIREKEEGIVEELPTQRNYSFKSGVNIMYGCNNFCSYCIVPYVRGRERSREPKAILREI